jgi:NADP-dependent aldehyde dehydrogenase
LTDTSSRELDQIVGRAREAFAVILTTTAAQRATWLTSVADALDDARNELVELGVGETHLTRLRLEGEVARTTAQLRLFTEVLREGSYLEATVDHRWPEMVPPRPDLRRMLRPVGVVAVFAASNFPFAFSVAGGDMASALAVGCPVVVKAHPGHAELSRRTASIVEGALARAGAPVGTFALVEGHQAGVDLVQHPGISAAAFTGSLAGGRALFNLAASRPDPIPFFGELGSINPVVVMPAADRERGEELAAGLAASFTLGAGQFCTKPGLVFVPAQSHLASALTPPGGVHILLTESISSSFLRGLSHLSAIDGVDLVRAHSDEQEGISAVVAHTTIEVLEENREVITSEVFGPVTVLVSYSSDTELLATIAALDGSLTATVHALPEEDIRSVVAALSDRAGRILFDGWPTGVAVSWAQHHGGPWPATTSQHTSVGTTAVRRFQRPIAYQDAPPSALPIELRDENELGIPRRVDGTLVV